MPINIDDEELYPQLNDGEAYHLVKFLHDLAYRLDIHYYSQIRRHSVGDGPDSPNCYLTAEKTEELDDEIEF